MEPLNYRPHLLHIENWEKEFEEIGPIKESVHPSTHMCPVPTRSLAINRCPKSVGGYSGLQYLWDVVEKVVAGKKRIIDMGGGTEDRRLPGALNWSLENGHDMRDVSDLVKNGKKFDLIFSSHSLEHIESKEVQKTLQEWMKILLPEGELIILGPHRCGTWWSIVCGGGEHEHHWAPTAACIGNYLIWQRMILLGCEDHRCRESSFWVHLEKHDASLVNKSTDT